MPLRPSPTALLAALLLAASPACAADYVVEGRIAAPGDGGWDYTTIDPAAKRVYVTHGETVVDVDIAKGTASAPFAGIAKGHAAVPIPGRHLLAVTSGHDDSVRLFDTETGTELAKVPVGSDPDAAFYAAGLARVVVVNAKGGTVSLLDPVARTVTGTITLKPGLEAAANDGDTLLVNNEDLNELETANLRTGRSGPAVALTGCQGPTGLAFDPDTEQAISACANRKAAIVDVRHHRLVALLDIGAGPDTVLVDTGRRVALIPCGRDGTLTVIALGGSPHVVGEVRTEMGARTGALDPATGKVFLPAAELAPPPTAGGRPQPKAGTFHILVLAPR
ncbi:MAG: gluconolactonase [Sphingomonas sp.]|nr:gluconolactonase [Sphingomonas sp.]